MSKNLIITEPKFISPRWQQALTDVKIHAYDQPIPAITPDLLIWLLIPQNDWQHLCQTLSKQQAKVIVMSKIPNVDELKQALQNGARGYIHALSNTDVLKKVESSIIQGARWLPGSLFNELMTSLMEEKHEKHTNIDLSKYLTPKEIEITRLITLGQNNKSIAEKLRITERTVKAHLTSIFKKMSVRDRLELSHKAKNSF
jgi:DNA-binding NarL/FixJ family response regulator